jgi:hypothetical protein
MSGHHSASQHLRSDHCSASLQGIARQATAGLDVTSFHNTTCQTISRRHNKASRFITKHNISRRHYISIHLQYKSILGVTAVHGTSCQRISNQYSASHHNTSEHSTSSHCSTPLHRTPRQANPFLGVTPRQNKPLQVSTRRHSTSWHFKTRHRTARRHNSTLSVHCSSVLDVITQHRRTIHHSAAISSIVWV